MTGLALVVGTLVLARTRRPEVALVVLLELMTGAGLLRLAVDPTVTRVATAAGILLVRRLSVGAVTAHRAHPLPAA